MSVLFLPQPYATLATIRQTCPCEKAEVWTHHCVKNWPVYHSVVRDFPSDNDALNDPLIVAATSSLIDMEALNQTIAKIALAHTGPKFMGWPDTWIKHATWLCTNGHVSKSYVNSDSRGKLCQRCMDPVRTVPTEWGLTKDLKFGEQVGTVKLANCYTIVKGLPLGITGLIANYAVDVAAKQVIGHDQPAIGHLQLKLAEYRTTKSVDGASAMTSTNLMTIEDMRPYIGEVWDTTKYIWKLIVP